jgi:hypothetical protein
MGSRSLVFHHCNKYKKLELLDFFVEGKTMHQLKKTSPKMPMESDCYKRYYKTNKCMRIKLEFNEKSY